MSMPTGDVAHLLIALALLLVVTHACGSLFAGIRQPRVIGEILGGLLLGPTVLGAAAPALQAWLFPAGSATETGLRIAYQLGLLLLMFCTGAEIRAAFGREEARPVTWISVTGLILPFLAGLAFLRLFAQTGYWGTSASSASFTLVFATAIAVTSIPVISRIMHDLGILDTGFARIVLGVAVVEDVVLYVVLAIAVGLAASGADSFGLPAALGLQPGGAWDALYHVVVTVGILWLFLGPGRIAYPRVAAWRFNVLRRRSPVAYQLVFMLAATIACLALGVEAFFGAFLAGITVGAAERNSAETKAIASFSFAFFIPLYFGLVGFQLDLLHGFNLWFFGAFLLFACAAKGLSVYLGARVAGETGRSSLNLAVAMNARGGPGIVLASVAYAAGIVNEPFYAILVMLAIVTSLMAGAWLERVPRDRLLERPEARRPAGRSAGSPVGPPAGPSAG
jgi:Kef-type K+ transport system membrane component KefB